MIKKIYKKIFNMVKRGLVTNNRNDFKGQCSYMETVSNYESIKPLGLESLPVPNENLVILLNLNGNDSYKAGFEYNNKDLFDAESLLPGETVLFNHLTQLAYLILKNTGQLKIVGSEITASTLGASLKIGPSSVAIGTNAVELLDQVSQLCTQTAALATSESTHTHVTGGVTSTVPSNSAALVTIAANINIIKASIESIKGTL